MKLSPTLKAALVALSSSAFVSGCAVGPDFVKPETATQPEFSGAAEAGATQGQLLERWWSNFSDPTLNTLVADAIRSNVDLRGAIARVNQARAIRDRKSVV